MLGLETAVDKLSIYNRACFLCIGISDKDVNKINRYDDLLILKTY